MMGSNRGNRPKHPPGYVCYKAGKPGGGKKAREEKAKQIATGKKRAQELAKLSGR
jgi:hypothetical protein